MAPKGDGTMGTTGLLEIRLAAGLGTIGVMGSVFPIALQISGLLG